MQKAYLYLKELWFPEIHGLELVNSVSKTLTTRPPGSHILMLPNGESRPSTKGGRGGGVEGLTMNVEFCKNNSGSAQKMCYYRKIGGGDRRAPPLDLPLLLVLEKLEHDHVPLV